MNKQITFLLAAFFVSSCTVNNKRDIELLSFNKAIDKTSNDFEFCEDFQLNESDIYVFFQVAEQINNEDAHGQSLILPCKYEGKLTINKDIYSYEVFAGGSGGLYDKNGWVVQNFICKSNNCCSQFSDLC